MVAEPPERPRDVLAEIEQRLQKYPQARYDIEDQTIRVLPTSADGFTVGLTAHERGYTVWFEAWHEEFTSAEEALHCFAFGLSEDCRLKVWRRGDMAYRWTVESRNGEEWVEDSTTGLFFFPFWRALQIVTLQNHLIIPGEPAGRE